MGRHRSLQTSGTLVAKRNVLKRRERINLLAERGKWKEGQRALGLPKTKPTA
ncbi:MAG: small basic protein [Verrucomicrobiae bacterium]|nr:small basic protein [Verrucomicrobiae bacterium]